MPSRNTNRGPRNEPTERTVQQRTSNPTYAEVTPDYTDRNNDNTETDAQARKKAN